MSSTHGLDLELSAKRMGPLAVLGSTVRPPCFISIKPRETNLRAAIRVRSISDRQPSSRTARAASDGQIDEFLDRC